MRTPRPAITEWIDGPFYGFYLAGYAQLQDDGYCAYIKICTGKPDSVWAAPAVHKVCAQRMPHGRAALLRAREQAIEVMTGWLARHALGEGEAADHALDLSL